MKRVRPLLSEPALLAAYRANPAAGAQRPASAAAAVWTRFRKRAPDAYRELVEELAVRQQGLCLYCEQRLVDADGALIPNRYQVEHVLPKSGAAGRVLDWTNLALACWGTEASSEGKSCGATKLGTSLPHGCDPRVIPLTGALFGVGLDGKLLIHAGNCTASGVAPGDAEGAIRLVNLDCERLRKPRQDAGDATREKVAELLRALIAVDAAVAQQTFGEFAASRLSPDAAGYLLPFWSAERAALGTTSESWISNNQGMLQ